MFGYFWRGGRPVSSPVSCRIGLQSGRLLNIGRVLTRQDITGLVCSHCFRFWYSSISEELKSNKQMNLVKFTRHFFCDEVYLT